MRPWYSPSQPWAIGQLSYENALAVSIGSNVGTTVTAILGAISANAEGKRLAVAHLAFNVITALLAIILIEPLINPGLMILLSTMVLPVTTTRSNWPFSILCSTFWVS